MSKKSERKKAAHEAKKNSVVPSAAIAVSEPVEELPIFNTEQLTRGAIAKLAKDFKCLSVVCEHIEESRRNPNSDTHGYFEKAEVKQDGEVLAYAFIKSCAACANTTKNNLSIVARISYRMLSDHTLKAMLKNQGRLKMVPTSQRGRELAAEAAAEGPDSIN